MAAISSWWISCIVLVHSAYLGSCDLESDYGIGNGSQPELFIFHELCALKKDEGPCKAVIERFYFDIDTGHCKVFEFGGCKGNANNFESLEACERMCLVSADKSPCHLEEAPGPCRGLVSRYFFDSRSKECKHFYYGGCFGNANNFRSMKECQARCQNPDFTPPELCFSRIDRGTTCEGEEARMERRYVYNPKTKRCQWLRYSGCGGNKNNFVLKRHCIKMCMKPGYTDKRNTIRIKKKNLNILFRSV
ncbi:tissue factor pathway inhibitor a isoform X5 [Esox lucius]|uniref:tissue factor pathway inhibitor a isoform X5 n=1 Tax=Esox lucius TaxID=8010 RepID=UPI00097322F9|nr:tissue factor pathway inhibitor a isoform X5 [Esox lucius]